MESPAATPVTIPALAAAQVILADGLERKPRGEIAAEQARRLRALLAWIHEKSDFWREHLDAAGVKPHDVETLADLRRIPTISKSEHAREQAAHPLFGRFVCQPELTETQGCWLWKTSGTTERPRWFITSKEEFWRYNAAKTARAYLMGGLQAGDKVLLTLGGYNLWAAAWAFHFGVEVGGGTPLPTALYDTRTKIEILDQLRPIGLHGIPSYLVHLGEVAEELGYKPADLGVRKLFVTGEYLPPPMFARLRDLWGATSISQSYAGAEFQGCAAASCREQTGMHCYEDYYIIEVLDPQSGEPAAPGQTGEVVITPLFPRVALFSLRFRTGDLSAYTDEPCSCGRTTRRLLGIVGRVDDVVKVRGVSLHPVAVAEVLAQMPEFGEEFQVVARRDGALDHVTLNVELRPEVAAEGQGELVARLKDDLKRKLGLGFGVEVKRYGALPRAEGKPKRLIDQR